MKADDYGRLGKGLLQCMAAILIIKITINIVSNYGDYFPPNFESDFLFRRRETFFGLYQVAFYAHIVGSPITMMSGMILLSQRFRMRFPAWHRLLGKGHVFIVLFCLVPSGLWMSAFAYTGWIAGAGFFCLAVATGTCAFVGWRLAVQKRFKEHRRWMIRLYVLLCSAILLRLIAGISTVANFDAETSYRIAAWGSWLIPLLIFELTETRRGLNRHSRNRGNGETPSEMDQ